MAFIDKLLNKFSKVKQAINSLKGIQSKIQAINYTTAYDALGAEKAKAEELLEARRSSLENTIGSSKIGENYAERKPPELGVQLVYPVYDKLANYIVFVSRKRRTRDSFTDHEVHKERQVALYVPDALISQSSVTYQADGVNPVARALNEVVEAWEGPEGSASDAYGVAKEQANKIGTKFIQQALNTMTGGLSNLKRGRAINPMQEQMLQGIPFRSWDFTFDFWPKSSTEASAVNEIIYVFRSSMLPDVYSELIRIQNEAGEWIWPKATDQVQGKPGDKFNTETNASYFNYPNVFEIYFEGPLGTKIDGFLPAVCTNAQVDYTGGQKFSTFADGQPVHIQLTLNFLEIQVMTLGNYEFIRGKSGSKGTGDPNQNMSIVDRQSRGDYSDDPDD